ncbi:hypothetical protein XA68_13092 [Ophiocordyceps unilateralis]|uniref:RRM domain-containing protein n=1 Tax=Ophiocordyceps unilateralis TaxID=268505 RepID=A0A2A9PC54_OPHUN|nr:hypothetical protein XA68_13092 [Ophiocordyceps unilateralis]
MAQNRHWEQDKEATVYIGNIDERASTAMVYEIMLQMGPIHNIHMPRDRVTQNHQGFGFVEFRGPQDAEYAAQVMNGIKLYGKPLRVNKASADKQKGADVGAELFVGNLDHMVDEKILYDTFSRFGPLLSLPKVARDDNAASKGFGFVSFADFESSDTAIANLNGQYILSKEVSVQYAFKKDGRGERHGDEAERQLAAQAKIRNIIPEAQPIPQAFLAQPSAQTQPAPPSAPAGAGKTSAPPPGFEPPGAAPLHHGMPSSFAPPPALSAHHRPGVPMFNGVGHHPAPPLGPGGRVVGPPLPPAPTGLPARPPQGQPGFNNPADYHPGSFRPPNGAPAAQPFPGGPSPPGFSVPPPDFEPITDEALALAAASNHTRYLTLIFKPDHGGHVQPVVLPISHTPPPPPKGTSCRNSTATTPRDRQ